MAKGLKNIAKGLFGGGSQNTQNTIEEIDRILARPITQMRMELKKAYRKKEFTQDQYDDFVTRASQLKEEDLERRKIEVTETEQKLLADLQARRQQAEAQAKLTTTEAWQFDREGDAIREDIRKQRASIDREEKKRAVEFQEQKKLAAAALETYKVGSALDLDISSPSKQLLWAAALTRMMDARDEPITTEPIWKQLQDTATARNEMGTLGRVIYASLQNDDVRVAWGQPGTWFFSDNQKNIINVDFYFTLVSGFEHTRAVDLHEIGHSELTNKFTPRMNELWDKIKVFRNPETGQMEFPETMTEAEQKEFALISQEWQMRQRFHNIVEDVCVDQFAANMSQSYRQDFGDSMNHMSTVLRGFGELARGDKEVINISTDVPEQVKDLSEDIEEQKKDLQKQQGGTLTAEQKKEFDDAEEALKQVTENIKKQQAEQAAAEKKAYELSIRPLTDAEVAAVQKGDISVDVAQKMFNQLQNATLLMSCENTGMFVGSDPTWERFRVFAEDIRRTVDVSGVPAAAGMDSFEYLAHVAIGKNGVHTMQPQPHDRYFGEKHYREIVARTTDERIVVMDHLWDLYLEKFAQVLMKEFEKKVEQEMKQQKQQGQGRPGEGQPGEGAPGEGQPGEGGGGGMPHPLSKALKKKMQQMKENPKAKNKKPGEGGKDGQKKKKKKGNGWGQDPQAGQQPSSGKKVGDLRKQEQMNDKMTKEEKDALKKQAQEEGDSPGQGGLSSQAGHGRGVDLAKLAKGDWNDFHRRVLELAPIINQVAQSLIEIRRMQKKTVMQQSKRLDYTAEDGDILGRLDIDKVIDGKRKKLAGVPPQLDDFKKVRQDDEHVDESTIEFFQMIDGSGSMPGLELTNGVSAMEAALQSAVIMHMACLKAGIDSYIVMWGDPEPKTIATPNSNPREVGELLEALRRGTGSGTDLAPGLKISIEKMAEHVNKNGTISGSSHIQVYSDGDIFDVPEARPALETIARHGKNLTVDVAVLRPPAETEDREMDKMVKAVIEATHSKMIGLMRGSDANVVPRELAKTLLKRVRKIEIKTEPDSVKRGRLKALHHKMNKNPTQ